MRVLVDSLRTTYSDRDVRNVALLLVGVIALATGFYAWMEGWSLLDSAYFAVTTITTTGAGSLAPSTGPGKLFTIVYMVVGLGLFLTLVQLMAQDFIRRTRDGRPPALH
jgi:voltage-gated potassium channel